MKQEYISARISSDLKKQVEALAEKNEHSISKTVSKLLSIAFEKLNGRRKP